LGFASSAFSQGRVIEETLVVNDPTVAATGKWKVGGAIEYWKVDAKYDIYEPVVGEATLDFKQTGYNLFAAYGNWTLQGTTRKGDADYEATGSTVCCGTVRYGGPQDIQDNEITLRYLWPTRSVSPYLLLGYTETKVDAKEDITSGNAIWTCTNTTHRETKTEYKGPLVGGGAVIPFSRSLGMRADLRLKWYQGKYDQTGTTAACRHTSGSGLGYDITLTGYWNIIGGLNAQLGFKGQWLNAGEDVPSWYKLGYFGMLGYTFQF
jgi:hypothetical protein